jgi:hypothetical protein
MTEILARLFKLPFNLMASSMGAVALAMQTVRDTWSEEIDQFAPVSSPGEELHIWPESAHPPMTAHADSTFSAPEQKTVPPVKNPELQKSDDTSAPKEKRPMHDTDLSGKDELKLVRFKILFIKRDFEHVFYEREELIHEDIDGQAFASWKIAEFIQEIGRPPYGSIPQKWRNEDGSAKYPPPAYRTGTATISPA